MVVLIASGWTIFGVLFLLIFGLVLVLLGIVTAWFGASKGRMIGIFQTLIGWGALIVLYFYFFDWAIIWAGLIIIGSVVIALAIAIGVYLGLIMRA